MLAVIWPENLATPLRPVVFIGRSETQNARSYSEQAFSSRFVT
jgi:hypothetical protein